MSPEGLDFQNGSIVIVPSPYGPVALTLGELHAGLSLADGLVLGKEKVSNERQLPRERLLDADKAAELLGVKASWLLTQARERKISCVKLGKYIRFDVAKLISEAEKQPW